MGTVTLSVELELAWRSHDLSDDYPILSHRGEKERQYLQRLLNCVNDLDISITFDIVGDLLHTSGPGFRDGPHPDGWFDNVPAFDAPQAPLFFAPEWADHLGNTHHEIATHTYSHILCSEASPELLRWELNKAREIQSRAGLQEPTSLVPPRHSPPDIPPIRDEGFNAVRSARLDWALPDGAFEMVQRILTKTPELAGPTVSGGVLKTYCTPHPSLTAPYLRAGQLPAGKVASFLPKKARQWLHQQYLSRGLSAAVDAPDEQTLHLWTHLSNLSNSEQWPVIEKFFKEIATARDGGHVEVKTMSDLASDRGLT